MTLKCPIVLALILISKISRVVLAAGSDAATATAMEGPWIQIPGLAQDIGVDARGTAWIVSALDKSPGGYAIYKRTGTNWTKIDGGAVKIAVAPDGDVWIVDDAGQVHYRKTQDARWTDVPGGARGISISPDGGIWKIGIDKEDANYGIYKYNGTSWTKLDGSAVRISAGNDGNIWIINSAGEVHWRGKNYWYEAKKWELQEGINAVDLAVDRKGPAWLLGSPQPGRVGDYTIFQDDGYHGYRKDRGSKEYLQEYSYTNGFHWHPVPGSASRIVMQQNGTPWVLRKDGSIYVSSLKLPTGNLFCTGFGGGYKITPEGDVAIFHEGGCNQAAFDRSGNMFMAVNKWSPTGSVAQIFEYPHGKSDNILFYDGAKDYIDNVYSLAVDPDGNVFFANWYAKSDRPKDAPADRPYYKRGIIFKLTPNKVLSVVDPNADRTYGLKCDAQGNLYNSGYGHSGDIYKYTLNGTAVKSCVVGQARWNRANDFDSQGNLFANGNMLIDPKKSDVVKGPDGSYKTDKANVLSGVIEIPANGAPQKLVAPQADRAESHPVGIACDANSDIYITDYYMSPLTPGVIYRCCRDGTYTVFATGLRQPMWLVMEPTPKVSPAH